MKKFLAVFLIAIVACEAIEDFDIEGWLDDIGDFFSDLWDKLSDAVKNAVNFLKDKGIYDLIKDKLLQAGKTAAITFCSAYLTPVVCGPAVEGLCTLLGI